MALILVTGILTVWRRYLLEQNTLRKQSRDKISSEQLLTLISQIEKEVEFTSPSGNLPNSPTFQNLHLNPLVHFEASKSLLVKRDVPVSKKLILAYSLQKLNLDELLQAVSKLTDATGQGLTPPIVLETLAFPGLEWGGGLVEYYDEMLCRHAIDRILAVASVSELKCAYIRTQVLTGKAKKNLLRVRES